MWGKQNLPTSDCIYRIFFMWVFQIAWKSHLLRYKMLLRTVTRLDKLMRPGLWEHYYFSRILCFSHILLMSLGRKSCSDICVSHRYMILMGHRVTTKVEAVFCSFKITRNGKGGTARKLQAAQALKWCFISTWLWGKRGRGICRGWSKMTIWQPQGYNQRCTHSSPLKMGGASTSLSSWSPHPQIFKSSLLSKHLPSSEGLCIPPNAFC